MMCFSSSAVFSLSWHISQLAGGGEGFGVSTAGVGVGVGALGGDGVGVSAGGFTIHTEGREGVGFVTGVGV